MKDMLYNKGLFFSCALFFLALCTALPLRAESGATSTVKAVLDKAMDIQTQPGLQGSENRKERANQTRTLIAENFLAEAMAKESLQDQWEKLAPAQRHQYQALFTGLFQDSYTRMVLNFLRRETVEYPGESPDGKQTRVKTVIMRTNEHIPVDYILVRKGPKWLILDVSIDGVSIVETYRNSLGKFIRTKGYDALIQRMRLQKKAGEES